MEAETLRRKKNSLKKGKLKKTIKNVLCRPDPVFWPAVLEEHRKQLETALMKHKVHVQEFKKLHWKELQSLPKYDRPKPPKLEKVEGFMFGILECSSAIQSGKCSAVIIESTVNPRSIVQPVLEACATNKVPVLCLDGLRKVTATNFGIKTSCLGVKKDCLPDITKKVIELAKNLKPPDREEVEKTDVEMKNQSAVENDMDTEELTCVYLYRTNKRTRVFIPPLNGEILKSSKEFTGQNFIEVSDTIGKKLDSKTYMKMLVKRMSNNPNRVKVK